MELITFDNFLIIHLNFQLVFSTVNHVLMFDLDSGRQGALQIQIRKPIKSIRIASNFAKRPWLEMKKRHCAHQKHAKQQDECYSTHSLSCSQKKSRV